jgi:hypothetical protein
MSHEPLIKKFQVVLLFLCLLSVRNTAASSPYYDNNPNIRLAHRHLYELKLTSAERLLQTEEGINHLNGYITFYRLYGEIIALTISNSPDEFKKREPEIERHIRVLKSLPANTPEYRMLLGEAYIYEGLLNVKYENKFSGLIETVKGYNLLKDNEDEYPAFDADNKLLGLVQIAVAFMPRILKWGAKLFNIKSDPKEGLKNLERFSGFARGKPGYEEEAYLFRMTGYRLMNEEDDADRLIKDNLAHFRDIAVISLVASTVCVQANDAETGLELLSAIKPEELEIAFPQLQYMTAKAKLLRLDPDADIPMLLYLRSSSGTDYIKSMLYDLACFYFIEGDTTRYLNYIEQVNKKGREFLSRDAEALYEAGKPGLPVRNLLRADLLVRGGYYIRAEKELSQITNTGRLNDDDKAMYYFVRGECLRLRNLVRPAEREYSNSIVAGGSSGSYFAQKSLVYSGIMMEKNRMKKEAMNYYNSCLHFSAKNNPYSDFYKNKARAGLIRLSLSE